jgi:ATP-dependent DNA helicase RecG
MMDNELYTLMKDIESDRVERKASLSSGSEPIGHAICALANDLSRSRTPGVLFVGAYDDGSCANLNINEEIIRRLTEFSRDGSFYPLPMIDVHKKTLGGCELAVVVVHPTEHPPMRYKQTVWVRVGNTTRRSTQAEEQRLSENRQSLNLTWDIRAARGATIDDLDDEIIRSAIFPSLISSEVLRENNRNREEQLSSLKATCQGVLLRQTWGYCPQENKLETGFRQPMYT